MKPTHRLCGCIVAACMALLLAQPGSAQTGGPGGKPLPKLVLFMVVDGFPQEQLVKYYDQYGPRGFKLWLDKGAWYGNNHYSHATTYTGVGHATLLSCAHPYKHGVVGNDWIDKATGKRLYSTEDARYKYLDEPTAQHAGTSPFNMKVTTVGDELLYANGKSKVIAIAGKDRSSIGLAGQSGTAYMHSTATGRFITSEYYMSDYPAWWKSFYASKPQNKYFGQSWTPLLPEEAYARSAPDNRPWSINYKGLGTRFPHASAGDPKEPEPGVLRYDDVDAVRRSSHAGFREGGHRGRESRQQSGRGPPTFWPSAGPAMITSTTCSVPRAASRRIKPSGSIASLRS